MSGGAARRITTLLTPHAAAAPTTIANAPQREFPTRPALVAAGLGVAVLPGLAADSVPPNVSLVPVEPAPHRRVFAVWRAEPPAGRRSRRW
jgi:DNA-binding transcriptional LysR family regulator